MKHQFALPDDSDLDQFDCGDLEVNRYFVNRAFFNKDNAKCSPPTYQFCTAEGSDVLGYAAYSTRSCPHPNNACASKAKYMTVYAAGLHLRWHGIRNPNAPGETYAYSMFRVIEAAARAQGSVGLSLWVRDTNIRAIAFYVKFGFVGDPGGSVLQSRDDAGPPLLTMRKLF